MSGLINVQSFSSGWQIFSPTPAASNSSSSAASGTTTPVTATTDPGASASGATGAVFISASITFGSGSHVGGCNSSNDSHSSDSNTGGSGTTGTSGVTGGSGSTGSSSPSGFEDLFQQMSDALEQLQQFMTQFQAALSSLLAPQSASAAPAATDTTSGATGAIGTSGSTTPVTTTDPTTTTPATTGTTASQPSLVDIRARERFSFDFVTQEGDVVHLRLGLRAEAAAAQDGSGNTLSGASISERISMSVKGQLNAQEMAAIASVITQVEGMAQQALGGDASTTSTAVPAVGAAASAAASSAVTATPADSTSGLNIDTSQLASVGFRASIRYSAEYATAPLIAAA